MPLSSQLPKNNPKLPTSCSLFPSELSARPLCIAPCNYSLPRRNARLSPRHGCGTVCDGNYLLPTNQEQCRLQYCCNQKFRHPLLQKPRHPLPQKELVIIRLSDIPAAVCAVTTTAVTSATAVVCPHVVWFGARLGVFGIARLAELTS